MDDEIRKLVLKGKGGKIRDLLLTKDQVELVKKVARSGTMRATLLSHLQGISLQSASGRLKRLYEAGYLDRADTSSPSGGIEYFYTVKKLTVSRFEHKIDTYINDNITPLIINNEEGVKMDASELIQPDMIETENGQWWDSFGNNEKEISAKLFVRACKKAESWTVTEKQLNNEDSSGSYWHNGLFDNKLITDNGNGTFTANHPFIAHCFGKFPAKT